MPTPRSAQSLITRYALSVLAVALTTTLRFLLVPLVSQDLPYLLFFIPVTVAAWIGGLGPGIFATMLAGVLNQYFFLRPFHSLSFSTPDQPAGQLLFGIEGICISWICARMQRARQRAEDNAREARELEGRILEISDAEQRRIGHDLHDGLGQHLTGISLITKRLEQRLINAGSPEAAEATKLSDLARTAVSWTHYLSQALSPRTLENEGLPEALTELALRSENIFAVHCALESSGPVVRHDPGITMQVYRICQEAITNAVKHGQAKNVRIQLLQQQSKIVVKVLDDGTGIIPSKPPGRGMGLRIMQYRAKMMGATVSVAGADGGGTVVTLSIPESIQQGWESK